MRNTLYTIISSCILLVVISCAKVEEADPSLKIVPGTQTTQTDPHTYPYPYETPPCTPPVDQTHFYSDTSVWGLLDPQYFGASYIAGTTMIDVTTIDGELQMDFGMNPVKTGVYLTMADYTVHPGNAFIKFRSNSGKDGYPVNNAKIYVKVNDVTGQTTIIFCHLRVTFSDPNSSFTYGQYADGSVVF